MSTCSRCGGDAALQCSACKQTRYCGAACQRADWSACHHKSCSKEAGLLVVTPCGAGKSTWLASHPDSGWVEGDDLYAKEGVEVGDYEAVDRVNIAAKKEGMKVMTSIWWTLDVVDAVVLPDVAVLEERCSLDPRPGNVPAAAVATLRAVMDKMAQPPPVFDSIEDAVQALCNPY